MMNPITRQLIRASLPLQRAYYRRRMRRPYLEQLDEVSLLMMPEVFNGVVFRTGVDLARYVAALPQPTAQRSALDMGTGSGIGAVAAARRGYRVTAVDINPQAVRLAQINAVINRCEQHIDVREGDLFSPVAGQQFDLVLFNPPYFRGVPRNDLDRAWRATDVLERFAAGLPDALAPAGTALIVFADDGDTEGLLCALRCNGLATETVACRDHGAWNVRIYRAEAARQSGVA